jgi:cell division protein FtsL
MSAIADARGAARARTRRGDGAGTARTIHTARSPLGGGILWIVLVGLLLAGIVAINVVVLQLNVQLDQLGRERAQLKADIATMRAQLSSASANQQIETRAAAQLGLVQADPALTTYVRLEPPAR